jgi:GT2 family glycosyltransferase
VPRILEQQRAGAATARNAGAAVAKSPLLLFLDDDMIAERNLLQLHLRRHTESPGAIVLGAIPVHPASPPSFMTKGLKRWADRRHEVFTASACSIPVTEVLTGHMSMARATFDVLGGFDTRFTAGGSFGGEDIEFGWRARQLGVPIVYEGAAVTHQFYAKTFLSLARNIRQAATADMLMADKHEEVRELLPLGRTQLLSVWEHSVLRATLAMPRASKVVVTPLMLCLELTARLRLSGSILENLHALCRAHLYGLGMRDALHVICRAPQAGAPDSLVE